MLSTLAAVVFWNVIVTLGWTQWNVIATALTMVFNVFFCFNHLHFARRFTFFCAKLIVNESLLASLNMPSFHNACVFISMSFGVLQDLQYNNVWCKRTFRGFWVTCFVEVIPIAWNPMPKYEKHFTWTPCKYFENVLAKSCLLRWEIYSHLNMLAVILFWFVQPFYTNALNHLK